MKKVRKLKEMVDYQRAAIVSRTVLDRERGTITLFAFDKGQGLSEHTAPYQAMIYLVEGEGEITVGQEKLNLKEGEMTILPANVPHAVKATRQFKRRSRLRRGQCG